ncbi:biotin transporter BioY [Cellulomonas alba]|uniref:Biotin transporter BioY n=1 Tax=Cellulomonas alba TaxID=3053467 RepID=A0ABT7SJV5_9CELL|nr:biotin transporter BioY [Cellulomonas alba]MDM7856467.1 biotin transporter BioY [Cellulomonas alba]
MSGTTTDQHHDPATAPTPPATAPVPVVRRQATTDVALVATFAAFIAVCSIVPGVPGPAGVPFTLQTFAVVLAGLVLGARRGLAAVALYLVVGLAGVPVFADHSAGLAVLTGPTGGYLVGFLAAATVAGALAGPALHVATRTLGDGTGRAGRGALARLAARPWWRGGVRYVALLVAGLVASPVVLDVFGIAGLVWRAGLSFHAAFAANLPFVPGDVIKTALAALVALTVFRAFPDLARTRR